MMTYSDLYLKAKKILRSCEDEQAASLLARDLLAYAAGVSREKLVTMGTEEASEQTQAKMDFFISRSMAGEPLAYILGRWEFYGMELTVNKDVLIPRDDTCAVTELAIKQCLFLPPNPRILDLCTGSGCIGLAIANRVKDARVTLGDISKAALTVAKKNITDLKMSGRVSAVQTDALAKPMAFLGKFDMIVSNPPYITSQEMKELPRSVADYEPHLALHGGDDGLEFYRAIARNYSSALKPGGYLCFEFGMGQGDSVCAILEENGYTILERTLDFNERERAVLAQYTRKDEA